MSQENSKSSFELIDFAAQDLEAAKILFKNQLYNLVCFHSQQCVEKSLKTLIIKIGESFNKSHSLIDLLAKCDKLGIGEIRKYEDYVIILDRYYIPTRYPEAILAILPDGRLPNESDAREAYQMAEEIYNFVVEKI